MNSKAQPKTSVKVKLINQDGNAFYILGAVTKALRQAGYDKAFIQSFQDEATAGDYNHLLQTVMEYVIVE
jgi:hypothetical protein